MTKIPLSTAKARLALAAVSGIAGGLVASSAASAHLLPAHGAHLVASSCDTYGTHTSVGGVSDGQAEASTRQQACTVAQVGVKMKWQNRYEPHNTGTIEWKYNNGNTVYINTFSDNTVNEISVNPSNSDHYVLLPPANPHTFANLD